MSSDNKFKGKFGLPPREKLEPTPQPTSISSTQNAVMPDEPKKLGRPKAKRSDTRNFTQVSGYIPKHVYLAVKKKMLAEEERDGQRREFSVILKDLLTDYAREFID